MLLILFSVAIELSRTSGEYVHYTHIELAHNNFRQEWGLGTRLVYNSTALIQAAKSLVPLNVKGHGKLLYQKPQLKSMVLHGAHPCIAQCISAIVYMWGA